MYSGRCLCGAIEFAIDGELPPIQICYCKQCQRAQGTVFATNIPIPTQNFRLLKGHESVRAYESSAGKERCFCTRCGSPLFSRRAELPNVVRVRAGLIDGPLPTSALVHAHLEAKPNWWV